MRKMSLFFLLAFYQLGLQAFAESPEEIFMNNDEVKAAIAAAQERGCEIGEPSKVFLKGSCGFAGCFETYLVGVAVHPGGINPQSRSITARMSLLNGNLFRIMVNAEED